MTEPPANARAAKRSADADRLLAERRRTAERLAALQGDFAGMVAASRGSNADDEHDPEGATIAFERSQLEALIRQAQERLREVDRALERWDAGRYGVCSRCGGSIDPARLEARPTATTCLTCIR
ncbi:TraR/DksA family transcriptional regulator [Nocardioides terrisoli]|uniref:TraR/DksA family transcriptional regulator n=1 Tax=Nocardioides terrisoli TaxID=3388267 RepID=UPI00287BBAA3|nr:TraR/DksA C4-type zinc finger protein [Nocardioides marmorisolisilvae]